MNSKWWQKLGNVSFQTKQCNLFFKCGLQKVLFTLLGISIGILAFRISFVHKFVVWMDFYAEIGTLFCRLYCRSWTSHLQYIVLSTTLVRHFNLDFKCKFWLWDINSCTYFLVLYPLKLVKKLCAQHHIKIISQTLCHLQDSISVKWKVD